MRSKTSSSLKDQEKLVRLEKRASILEELDDLIETYEKRLLGDDTSSSVETDLRWSPRNKPPEILNCPSAVLKACSKSDSRGFRFPRQ